MSECVVRMEMPQGCWGCSFGHYDWIWGDDGREKMVCFCCLDGESEEDGHYLLETEQKRPSWCPIVCALPEGHGGLMDKDAFLRTVRPASKDDDAKACTFTTVKRLIVDHIRAQKTIVPATETEDTPCP